MRKIAATYIFPVYSSPVKNGLLVCDNDGFIHEIIYSANGIEEQAGVEYYSGILFPGIIKTHSYPDLQNFATKYVSFSDFSNAVLNSTNSRDVQKITPTDRKLWGSGYTHASKNTDIQHLIVRDFLLLQKLFPTVLLDDLISFFCLSAAKAIGQDDLFGSFEPGKNPGVNLLTGIDFKTMKLTEHSKVKRLV